MKLFGLLFVLLAYSSIISAGGEFDQYQGQHFRKSITVTDLVDLRANSYNSMVHYTSTSDMIRSFLHLERFDYNNIQNSSAYLDFNNAIENSKNGRHIGQKYLQKIIAETIAEQILTVTKDSSQTRAKQLITDAQASSQLSVKMKEDFVYESQVEQKANKAYLFVPVVNDFDYYQLPDSTQRKELQLYEYKEGYRIYNSRLSYGVYVFRINKVSNGAQVTYLLYEGDDVRKSAILKGKNISDKLFDKSIVSIPSELNGSGIKKSIESIEDFILTEQITSSMKGYVEFPLGKKEGISINDKYWHTSYAEKEGSVEQVKNGWVIVTNSADESSAPYNSEAKVISGKPDVGDVVKEIPLLGVSATFGYLSKPLRVDVTNIDHNPVLQNIEVGNSSSFLFKTSTYIGESAGINQLSLNLEFGFGGGSASGETVFDSTLTMDHRTISTDLNGYYVNSFGIGVSKRIYFGRFSASPTVNFLVQSIDIDGGTLQSSDFYLDGETYLYWMSVGTGLYFGSGFEYAVSPTFNIGLTVGYNLLATSNQLDLYASSESTSPTWQMLSNIFSSTDSSSTENDRIDYMPVTYETINVSQSGFAITALFSFEF